MKIFFRFILKMKNISKNVVEKIYTYFLWSVILFSQTRVFYGISWRKMTVRLVRNDNKIRSICFACWIIRTTKTHNNSLLIAFLLYKFLVRSFLNINIYVRRLTFLNFPEAKYSAEVTRWLSLQRNSCARLNVMDSQNIFIPIVDYYFSDFFYKTLRSFTRLK
jgi:hypothetical protein